MINFDARQIMIQRKLEYVSQRTNTTSCVWVYIASTVSGLRKQIEQNILIIIASTTPNQD